MARPTPEEVLDALRRVTQNAHSFRAWRNALDVIHRADAKVPYPEHCRHPDQCAGARDCPRDPVCID